MSSSRPSNPQATVETRSSLPSPMTSRHPPPTPIKIYNVSPGTGMRRMHSDRRKTRTSWRDSIVRSPGFVRSPGIVRPTSIVRSPRQKEEAPPTPSVIEPRSATGSRKRGDAILALVLFNRRTRVPIFRRIAIPGRKKAVDSPTSPQKTPGSTSSTDPQREFDDEKLFKLIRAEYGRMRGTTYHTIANLFRARDVRDVGFLSFSKASQLIKSDRGSQRRKTFPVSGDDGFAESEMLALYRSPKLGRGEYAWVDWIGRRPENNGVVGSEKIALELVEGWCVRKIGLALVAVLLASALSALLWTFLGAGGCTLCFLRTETQTGFRNAGGRLETGLMLGLLVLLLGWTTVGAWAFLSWLV